MGNLSQKGILKRLKEQVECPLHGSVFNVTTGEVIGTPAEKNLRVFQVQIGSQAKGSIGKAPESRRVVHESVLAKGEVGTEPDP